MPLNSLKSKLHTSFSSREIASKDRAHMDLRTGNELDVLYISSACGKWWGSR